MLLLFYAQCSMLVEQSKGFAECTASSVGPADPLRARCEIIKQKDQSPAGMSFISAHSASSASMKRVQ